MNNQLSIYLDAVRVVAALLVFVAHLSSTMGGWLWQLGGLGHEAVVFFFVLSGYVIAYVTTAKEKNWQQYALSRAARIYSVAFPALILTIVLYYLGRYIDAEAFVELDQRLFGPVVTILSALFFLNQGWFSITVFSNMPYWSLGYEVLYYVLFGLIIFVHGRKKIPLILLVLIIMGPSVILYFPVWLLGVLSYKVSVSFKCRLAVANALFFLSMISIGLLCLDSVQAQINGYVHSFFGAKFVSILNEPAENFGADYCLAIAVAMNIFAVSKMGERLIFFNESISRVIKGWASYTFSIYLYHMPILFFVTAVAPYEKGVILNVFLCLVVTPLIIFLLGNVTENKKGRFKSVIGVWGRAIAMKTVRH